MSTSWAADKIEQWPTAKLVPYARNARTHSEAQVAQIAASIREFGFTNPVLIDGKGGIIAGHGRVLAARKIGLTVVPCVRLAHLSEVQKRAYLIADNKIALNAGWDENLLDAELDELMALGVDMQAIGFDDTDEIDTEQDSSLTEISTGPVDDDFWISISGPLEHQARALQQLQEVMRDMPLVITLGTVSRDA